MAVQKTAEYIEFIQWTATPEPLRNPKTQKELAEKLHVVENTLTNWKEEEGFWDEVKKALKVWGKNRTPNVIMGLYHKAVRDGNAFEAKLWLQYFEDWTEKQEVKQDTDMTVRIDTDGIYIHTKDKDAPEGHPDEPQSVSASGQQDLQTSAQEQKPDDQTNLQVSSSPGPAPSDEGAVPVQGDQVRQEVGKDDAGDQPTSPGSPQQ